jgi:hypothetical protein
MLTYADVCRLYVVVPPGDEHVSDQLQANMRKAGAFSSGSVNEFGWGLEGEEFSSDAPRGECHALGEGVGGGRGGQGGGGKTFQAAALGAVFSTVFDFYVEQVSLLAHTSVGVWHAVRRRLSRHALTYADVC